MISQLTSQFNVHISLVTRLVGEWKKVDSHILVRDL